MTNQPTDPTPSAHPEPVEGEEEQTAPNQRTFGLNSPEFHEATREPLGRPWVQNGSLPRSPRSRDPLVFIEGKDGSLRAVPSGKALRGR